MKKILLIILSCCCYSCTQHGGSLTAQQKERVTAEVVNMLSAYCHDVSREGLLAEFKYLDSSAEFFWVPPGFSSYLGYDSIATILRQNAPSYRKIENNWLTLHIVPLSDELANYTGKLRSVITDTSGHIQSVSFLETGTVIKRVGEWKLLCGQTTIAP